MIQLNSLRRNLLLFFLVSFSAVCFSQSELPIISFHTSVLSDGVWYKSRLSNNQIHAITKSDAASLGVDLRRISVYSNACTELSRYNDPLLRYDVVELPTLLTKDTKGEDILLFNHHGSETVQFDELRDEFSVSINKFSDNGYVYITEKDNPKRITSRVCEPFGDGDERKTFKDFHYIKPYEKNLIQSGHNAVSDRVSYGDSFVRSFAVENRIFSDPIRVSYSVIGKSSSAGNYKIKVNDLTITEGSFSAISSEYSNYADLRSGATNALIEDSNNSIDLAIDFDGSSSGRAWVDEVLFTFSRKLQLSSSPLSIYTAPFFPSGNVNLKIEGVTSETFIWEVKSDLEVEELDIQTADCIIPVSDKSAQYLAFNVDQVPAENLTWTQVDQTDIISDVNVDYLIISPSQFQSQAERLKTIHSNELTTKIVSPDQIYQLFSAGVPDVSAIRNYIRSVYELSSNQLKYVLLLGSGTYDNRSTPGEDNPNFIPTFQSDNFLHQIDSYVSDDYFSILSTGEGNGFGTEDIAVGRIPALNLAQATIAVDKIVTYISTENNGAWMKNTCFIADDEDRNKHMEHSEELAEMLRGENPEMDFQKIYFDAYTEAYTPSETYPDVNVAIKKSINDGLFLFNYTGHSNQEGLAHEKVFNLEDIEQLSNGSKLPIFVTASCDFTRWDYKMTESAGEKVLFHDHGGGIALLSSSRLVYSNGNFLLNKNFIESLSNAINEESSHRLGDVFLSAKRKTGGNVNSRKFGLFGDPALPLKRFDYRIKPETLNEVPLEVKPDISVLNQHTLSGKVFTKSTDSVVEDYSEDMNVEIVGGAKYAMTLGNGGEIPFEYRVDSDILYTGQTSIKDGEFSFSFILPLDVDYSSPEGSFVFSSFSESGLASGNLTPFTLIDPVEAGTDKVGPEVSMYLTDSDFTNGDMVGVNPWFYASFFDDSGVNTSGFGIGHEMLLILDEDYQNPIDISSGYVANASDFRKGELKWQLFGLSEGKHTLKLRVWDNANNYSESDITFVVSDGLLLSDLNIYPNPVQDFFYLTFSHAKPSELLETTVQIFDATGRLSFEEMYEVSSGDNKIEPLRIDLSQAYLSHGVGLLKVICKSSNGLSEHKQTKILLTR